MFGKKDPTIQESISAVIVPKDHAQVGLLKFINDIGLFDHYNYNAAVLHITSLFFS